MNKKITASSENIEPINESPERDMSFSKGFTFFTSGHEWTVTAEEGDSQAPMRRIVADDGSEDVVLLTSLQKDMKEDVNFKVIKK